MAAIPSYWYYETHTTSLDFKSLPIERGFPSPFLVVDEPTGEIHGEAVLMGRLPSPRFRSALGQEVVLPLWAADAFENLEAVLSTGWIEQHNIAHDFGEKLYARRKCWVQDFDGRINCVVSFGGHIPILDFEFRVRGVQSAPPCIESPIK